MQIENLNTPSVRRSLLEKELTAILSNHCGEYGHNEGAVDTLKRIIHEKDMLLRDRIERDIFHYK